MSNINDGLQNAASGPITNANPVATKDYVDGEIAVAGGSLTMATDFYPSQQATTIFGGGYIDATTRPDGVFSATGFITVGSPTLTLSLYNETDATTAASLTFTTGTPTEKHSGTLTFTGAKVYSVRASLNTSGAAGVLWAGVL